MIDYLVQVFKYLLYKPNLCILSAKLLKIYIDYISLQITIYFWLLCLSKFLLLETVYEHDNYSST